MARMIKLQSSDSKDFEVELGVASLSKTLDNMIKCLGLADEENSMAIPLPNVDGATLEKVIEWCQKHKNDEILEAPKDETRKDCDVPAWDKEFLTVDHNVLIQIVIAANYLDIRDLLDYSSQTVADLMKGKDTKEIRIIFEVPSDYTPEEEKQLEEENAWCST